MKIVVIGDGKVGFTLTRALSQEGHDLVVIDNQKNALTIAEDRLDVLVMEGNGASASVQKEAGVDTSDLLIAVTSADETNLVCCMVARKLGCKHTIARIRNPEYNEAQYLLRDELGLSMTVNPERIAAREIFGLLQLPSFLRRDAYAKGRAEIVGIPVRTGGKLDGIALVELYKTLKVRVLVCAVKRGSKVIIPDGSFVLKGEDHIYVTAPTGDLLTLVKVMGLDRVKIRSVMIVGGSRIAYYLAQMLSEAGIQVKLLESNMARCETLSAMLPDAMVVNADGTFFPTLLAEGLEETDAMVTLTNLDEMNLVISMYANHLHVPKVVTKINRTEYGEILDDSGAECVISPRQLVCNDILRYVRAMQNRSGAGVVALHRMVDDQVEAMEFRANSESWYCGVPLHDISLKPNVLVAVISHHGNVIVPRGADSFAEGDSVVIVTTTERRFDDLNDIFAEPPQGTKGV
ncbi:MAG: Trk system potassium transporter TrkA [Eubacteriales bacterium]|nr:Trk system potassium transporter TrkA [Eubacteriales bacterium]